MCYGNHRKGRAASEGNKDNAGRWEGGGRDGKAVGPASPHCGLSSDWCVCGVQSLPFSDPLSS